MKYLPLLLTTLILAPLSAAPSRPNIIILFADDISARELPVYGSSVWTGPLATDSSDPKFRAETPVIDKLAKEGAWINTAWAATVCSPSRAMMMTGRYAHIHKWWTNGDQGQYEISPGKFPTWPLYESSPLQLGHIAQKAGYGTFWAGKTQMAGDLTEFGFDEGCFTPGNLSDTDNPFTDFKMHYEKKDGGRKLINDDTGSEIDTYLQHGWYWNPHVRLMNHPGEKKFAWYPNNEASRKSFGLNSYGPDIELKFAFEFMERKQKEKQPFLIYHCSHLGHDAFDWFNPDSPSKWPGTPVVKWDGEKYTRTEPNVTGDHGKYDTHGSITDPGIHHHVNYLDYQVWLYQQKLGEMGIADNTVFIFCADNGTSGYGKHSPDRQKGTHVPLVIHAPGMKKHGEQDILVNLADILPTLADLIGFTLPADYEINGESLYPYLFTDKSTHRDWIYAYRGKDQLIRGTKVLRDGTGKWWNVSSTPNDLISFAEITDWNAVSEQHRHECTTLEAILPRLDLWENEHDAPGVVVPEHLQKRGKTPKKNKPTKPNKKPKS